MSLKEIRADIREVNAKLETLIELSIEIRNIKKEAERLDNRLSSLERQLMGLAIITIGGGIIAAFIAGVNKHII